jgi:hypothetical protein
MSLVAHCDSEPTVERRADGPLLFATRKLVVATGTVGAARA